MNKYIFSLALAASVGLSSSIVAAQGLENCSCITPAGTNTAAAGVVTSASGDVLVDGISAESNKIIKIGSQLLVGEGAVNISVGQSCQISISAQSEVLISQPGGVNSSICVRNTPNSVFTEAPASTETGFAAIPSSSSILGIALIGGGIAGVVALISNDDDNRPPSRPAASH